MMKWGCALRLSCESPNLAVRLAIGAWVDISKNRSQVVLNWGMRHWIVGTFVVDCVEEHETANVLLMNK